jgi:hypothetical protein
VETWPPDFSGTPKLKTKRRNPMERFKRFSLVASSLMLVLALVTVLGTKEVHAVVATMVQVINNVDHPVPVTGNVGINGTANVNVTNPLTVGIDSLNNTVKIDAASPVPVRDVDSPARHAFHASCSAFAASNEVSCGVTTVPAGQELVIQEVTLSVTTDPGVAVQATIITGAAGPQFVELQDTGGCENICAGAPTVHIYTGTTPLTTYADPGASVYISVLRFAAPPADGVNLRGTVSGYLVSVP